jgi:hypothetical protein
VLELLPPRTAAQAPQPADLTKPEADVAPVSTEVMAAEPS